MEKIAIICTDKLAVFLTDTLYSLDFLDVLD